MSKQKYYIDSSTGGNGDIWMRLISLYTVSELYPSIQFGIKIPQFLRPISKFAFGDRLSILESNEEDISIVYTSLGLKDLLPGILKGKKYLAPYQKAVASDKKRKSVKDLVNNLAFEAADLLGVVQVPASKHITAYQGFLDIAGLKKLKNLAYDQFELQLKRDAPIIANRLSSDGLPTSPQLEIPDDLPNSILVYPTGTSRQFVPVWWAKQFLPDAWFAFFFNDKEAKAFEKAGLKTIHFYQEPGDIISLSNRAMHTISTDSFPSHLLQSATSRCTITLTEVLKSRIISPTFNGKVVNSLAPCHPCLHLDRTNHPLCAAGYAECLNWKMDEYSTGILHSIPVAKGV